MSNEFEAAYHASQQRAALFNSERAAERVVIVKPEGYDLREKRAGKASDAAQWTAQDAVYSTYERIKDAKVSQWVAYWWEVNPDGSESLRYTNATTSSAEHALLLQKGLNALMNPKS